MTSLHALEDVADIKILTELARQPKLLAAVAGVTMNKSVFTHLEVLDEWKAGNSNYPPTWSSLLDILNNMNLDDLSQQIENYFGEP